MARRRYKKPRSVMVDTEYEYPCYVCGAKGFGPAALAEYPSPYGEFCVSPEPILDSEGNDLRLDMLPDVIKHRFITHVIEACKQAKVSESDLCGWIRWACDDAVTVEEVADSVTRMLPGAQWVLRQLAVYEHAEHLAVGRLRQLENENRELRREVAELRRREVR